MLSDMKKKCPSFIKKALKGTYKQIPDYYKYGKVFKETYEFLEESQWWDEKKLKDYQLHQLKSIISHAYNTVPYYKRVFDENNIKVEDIQTFDDIKKIPYLTKDIIRENLNDLISTSAKKYRLKKITTGGTTGMPMEFYVDRFYDKQREWAFIAHQWSMFGYDIKKSNKCVILRGDKPYKGIYTIIGNEMVLSGFKLSRLNFLEYLKLIEEFEPDFIQAYPSFIYTLSEYMIENNISVRIPNLKAILCASENIYDFQRKAIEKAFNIRVYSFYGHSEHACLATECEISNNYHIFSQYGYTEILNENGEEIEKEDEIGEIVCTSFNNYVMPIIRYKTNDMVVNTSEKCSCGRNYKLIKRVEGRKQEYFIDKFGTKVSYIYHDVPIWELKDKIDSYQYVQENKGEVILKLKLKNNLKQEEFNNIRKSFNAYYNNFSLDINIVDNIERTKSGKFRYLVQNIKE